MVLGVNPAQFLVCFDTGGHIVTCNNAFRTWSFRIACGLLAAAFCGFCRQEAAAYFYHYDVVLWQMSLLCVVPGLMTVLLPRTKALANWTVGCMDIPMPTAVLAAKGNTRPANPAPAPKRNAPGRVAVPAPAIANKQTTPAVAAPAEKPMKVLVENDKVEVAVSEPENGVVTITVTSSNMSNNQVKNENNGLFPLVRKVDGAKWEHHKSIGDKRKRITGTCPGRPARSGRG